MNKNQKVTNRAAKTLTVEDLKQVIGGTAGLVDPTIETGDQEDTAGNKVGGSKVGDA